MRLSTILFGLGIGVCTFAVTWATARHFTGLAQEYGLALAIGIAVGQQHGAQHRSEDSSRVTHVRFRAAPQHTRPVRPPSQTMI